MSDPDNKPTFAWTEILQFLKNSSSNYLSAKAELTGIEAKQAAEILAQRIGLFIKLAFFGFFAYAFFWISVIGIASKLLEGKLPTIEEHIGTWPIVILMCFVLHLLLVFIFIDKVKSHNMIELFKFSKEELTKDKLWIQQMSSRDEN